MTPAEAAQFGRWHLIFHNNLLVLLVLRKHFNMLVRRAPGPSRHRCVNVILMVIIIHLMLSTKKGYKEYDNNMCIVPKYAMEWFFFFLLLNSILYFHLHSSCSSALWCNTWSSVSKRSVGYPGQESWIKHGIVLWRQKPRSCSPSPPRSLTPEGPIADRDRLWG